MVYSTMTLRRRALALGALAYAALAVVLLHALLAHNGTHAASFDYFNYHWNFGWLRQALSEGQNIYLNNRVLAPFEVNFGYHALTAFWFPLWAVLEPLVGTLTAMTLILFVMCWLNGFVLYVFLLEQGVAPGLAFLGGLLLQASPVTRYFYYNNHINLGDWFWLPASLLLWGRVVGAAAAGRRRALLGWAGVMGLALWGIGHTDLQFPIFVAFWLAPYGLWQLWAAGQTVGTGLALSAPDTDAPTGGPGGPDGPTDGSGGFDKSNPYPAPARRGIPALRAQLLAAVAAVGIGGALLWWAGPLPYMAQFSGTLAPGVLEDRPGIPFPRGYVSLDPVWWWWNTPTLGGTVTLILLATLAAWARGRVADAPLGVLAQYSVLGTRYSPPRPSALFWLLVALPPLLISLGPQLTIGEWVIPMPYRLVYELTDGNFRMPWRVAPIFVASVAVFAARVWTPRLYGRGVPRGRAILALALVLLAVAWDVRLYQTPPVPGYIQPVLPEYAVYDAIGAERGPAYADLVVVDIPNAAGTGEILVGEPRAIQLQMYGITHGRRTVNGFISRAPLEQFWYLRTDDPLLSWLGQRRDLDVQAVEAQLAERIPAWPIGYFALHQELVGRDGPTNQEILGFFNARPQLVCPWRVERDLVIYRTAAHPDGCPPRTPPETAPGVYTLDLGAEGDERFIGWGWHRQEEPAPGVRWRWAGQYAEARLFVELPPGVYRVRLAAQAFAAPRPLQLRVEGQRQNTERDQVSSLPVTILPDTLQIVTFEGIDACAGSPGAGLTSQTPAAGRCFVEIVLAYDGADSPAALGLGGDERPLAIAVDWITLEWARGDG